jgi:carboxyl-terminal processing protease
MTNILRRLPPLLALLLWAPLASASVQPVALSELRPSDQMEKTSVIVTKVNERYHYRKVPLNNALSEKVMARYLEILDPNRSFFLQGDVDRFAAYRDSLDDDLRTGQLEPAFAIFKVYRERVSDRTAYALKLLERDFDFTKDESYRFDRSKAPWPKDQAELDDLWRKRVKNDFLSLRLAHKTDAEIRKTLRKRYEGLERRVIQLDAEDVFQSFMNAYTLSLEPHTSYMSPSSSENFDISMRLSLEGIGAVLRGDNEYTVVQKTVSGGPAEQSGQLHAGDKIVGVAQGLDGPMEDVVGWRLQDVVDKIRGPKGSVVRLEIISKGSTDASRHRIVSLVRNKIKLEDQAAKKEIIQGLPGMGGLRIGVITIPAFYRDFRGESRGDKNFRSTTRDVHKLLDELKAEHVDGIVVDLRENGGGSLSEATELTGLFVGRGPVVQVKDSFGKVEVEQDPDSRVVYSGPLAVLVDRNSASASEIFAGAIQDYRRGVIIGEPTFGKGTVQTLVDLSRFVPGSSDDLGKLRLTMAQFFRVNGASTQHRGVVPDITFPSAEDASEQGERSLENALPWAHIAPALYSRQDWGLSSYAWLRQQSERRVSKDKGFTMLRDQQRLLKELDETKTLSLNEKQRKAESEQRDKRLKEERRRYLLSQGITPRPEGANDGDDPEEDDKERKAIGKIELNEAVRILSDYVHEEEADDRPRAAMRD